MAVPTRKEEERLWSAGYAHVVGVDEVGRGAWAGPLTVGAVCIPQGKRLYKVRDSKQLSERQRELLYTKVVSWALSWAVGHASPAECDTLGMSKAQKLAAKRALGNLSISPDAVLLDGKWNFVDHPVSRAIVKGDTSCLSIAAASIVAKVTRDRMMREKNGQYGEYDFSNNKGYPSPTHKKALAVFGATDIHRTSWSFMDTIVNA